MHPPPTERGAAGWKLAPVALAIRSAIICQLLMFKPRLWSILQEMKGTQRLVNK
jgi:hypothetical protein